MTPNKQHRRAPPPGGQNILHLEPLALERCQHDETGLHREMHIACLGLIWLTTADSFLLIIKGSLK